MLDEKHGTGFAHKLQESIYSQGRHCLTFSSEHVTWTSILMQCDLKSDFDGRLNKRMSIHVCDVDRCCKNVKLTAGKGFWPFVPASQGTPWTSLLMFQQTRFRHDFTSWVSLNKHFHFDSTPHGEPWQQTTLTSVPRDLMRENTILKCFSYTMMHRRLSLSFWTNQIPSEFHT